MHCSKLPGQVLLLSYCSICAGLCRLDLCESVHCVRCCCSRVDASLALLCFWQLRVCLVRMVPVVVVASTTVTFSEHGPGWVQLVWMTPHTAVHRLYMVSLTSRGTNNEQHTMSRKPQRAAAVSANTVYYRTAEHTEHTSPAHLNVAYPDKMSTAKAGVSQVSVITTQAVRVHRTAQQLAS